jgi:hypothetical protein
MSGQSFSFRRIVHRRIVRALRPVLAEIIREEADDLVQWAMLLEKSHEKVFGLRIDNDGSLRQRINLLGLAPRDGLLAPLLNVVEHLLLESIPFDTNIVETTEEGLKQQPHKLRDKQKFARFGHDGAPR